MLSYDSYVIYHLLYMLYVITFSSVICLYLCLLCKEPALVAVCPFWYPAICCCLLWLSVSVHFVAVCSNSFHFLQFSPQILHFVGTLGLPLVGLPVVFYVWGISTLIYCLQNQICRSLREIHRTVTVSLGCTLDQSCGGPWLAESAVRKKKNLIHSKNAFVLL